MSGLQNTFSMKIIHDLVRAVKQDPVNSFEIVPTPASENKNSSPVLRGNSTLGFESWAVRHVLPYAHAQVTSSTSMKDSTTLAPCVLAVNLLHPEMPTAWIRRRELIIQKKMSATDELKITRLSLSRVPKSNEVLAHRRWLIKNSLIPGEAENILDEELDLADLIADRYPSNYHAWSHRQWCLQHLAPPVRRDAAASADAPLAHFSKRDMCYVFSASALSIYLSELEDNFKFVSSHVSDHSGLHFRQFLFNQIFSIFESSGSNSRKDKSVDCDNGSEALVFFSCLKNNLTDFLAGADNVDVGEYLTTLQYKLTLFDIKISLLVAEMKSNAALNDLFLGHEALWCYRRFLVFFFQSTLSLVTSGQSDVANVFLKQFLTYEKCIVSSHLQCKSPESDLRIIKNYCKWLKNVAKLDIQI